MPRYVLATWVIALIPESGAAGPNLRTDVPPVSFIVWSAKCLSVPLVPFLSVFRIGDPRRKVSTDDDANDANQAEFYKWTPGTAPMTARAVKLEFTFIVRPQLFHLDALIDDTSRFDATELLIGEYRDRITAPRIERHGSYREVNSRVALAPTAPSRWGQTVSFNRSRGLPVYSDDPDKAACTATVNTTFGGHIRFQFLVGSDFPERKQWPAPDLTNRDYSAWQEPIAEL